MEPMRAADVEKSVFLLIPASSVALSRLMTSNRRMLKLFQYDRRPSVLACTGRFDHEKLRKLDLNRLEWIEINERRSSSSGYIKNVH